MSTSVNPPLTEDELREIRERAEKATAGPWTFSPQEGEPGHCYQAQVWNQDGHSIAALEPTPLPASVLTLSDELKADADAAFIAHSRTDVIRLLDTIKADRAEIGRLRNAHETSQANAEFLGKQLVSQTEELRDQLSSERCAKIARGRLRDALRQGDCTSGGPRGDGTYVHAPTERVCEVLELALAQAIEGSDDPNPRGENV